MKPRHLILIVLMGTSLIAVAPSPEKAGRSDKAEVMGRPAQNVRVVPAQEIKIEPVSHAGDAKKLKKR